MTLFAGCETYWVDMYEPQGPEDRLSTVQGFSYRESAFVWKRAEVVRVDNLAVKEGLYGSKSERKIPVEAGEREFLVHFRYNRKSIDKPLESFCQVKANLEEGTDYIIRASVPDDDSKVIIWIENTENGTKVSEKTDGELQNLPKTIYVPV